MNDSPPASPLEFEIIPSSSDFASNDQRWLNQVTQLLSDLRRNAGEIRKEITPVPGQKGGVETIILALGTSGALTAAVTIFKAWLARSGNRRVRMKGKIGDKVFDLQIDGSNVEEQTVQLLAQIAGK